MSFEIKNVSGQVFRGPAPTELAHYDALRAHNIKYELDLETGHFFGFDGEPLEEALLADKYGIRLYGHPLGMIAPPTRAELTLAINFITDHQPVYVHCRQGVDRTGLVCAAWRYVRDGWTAEMALHEMWELGFHPWYWPWAMDLKYQLENFFQRGKQK